MMVDIRLIEPIRPTARGTTVAGIFGPSSGISWAIYGVLTVFGWRPLPPAFGLGSGT